MDQNSEPAGEVSQVTKPQEQSDFTLHCGTMTEGSCRHRGTDTLPLPAVTAPVVPEMAEPWAELPFSKSLLA